MATTGCASGSVRHLVSTARICSTMSKKLFIWVSMRWLSVGAQLQPRQIGDAGDIGRCQ
jgi:hypothetical protein